tara:strand:- start:217 stop:1080 length:864 start_codon:yes stop_codon:yes gene_type:complete
MLNAAELPLNSRKAVYHMDLTPEEIAETIITVGDPQRVPHVSRYFDAIELTRQHRELVTHTGRIGSKRISVVATGMGMPNIDIVMNELDALFNINLETREPHKNLRSFKLVRLGTTGAIQPDHAPGTFIMSRYAIGFDTLMNYYVRPKNKNLETLQQQLKGHLQQDSDAFFVTECPGELSKVFSGFAEKGITATCGGFYGPQSRRLRIPLRYQNLFSRLSTFTFDNLPVTNIEMETAAILGLGEMLGHQCTSLNVVLANRALGTFSDNIEKNIDNLIEKALSKIEAI